MSSLAVEVFANIPTTTVSSGGTTAPAAGTVETWTVASSTGFPAVSSSATPPTQCHVADVALNSEMILVTNISGTTWTVTRGAEGTTPVAHGAGFTIYQVVTAGAYTQLRGTDWLNVVTQFGADPTGVADSTTAIQNAINALSATAGGVVYLPAGTFKVTTTLTVNSLLYAYVQGDGRWATTIKFTGTGDCLRIYNTDTTGILTGGGVLDLTIDGTSAGNSSAGLHFGDMRATELRIAVQNFTGTSSIGVHFDNQNAWTEQTFGYLWVSNCTQLVVFDVSGNTTSTNSFGYTVLDMLLEAKNFQDGLVLQNGALLYHSRVSCKGNFKGTSTSNSSAAIRITGTIPAGHPGAGTGSQIANSRLDFMAECTNASGSNAPQTINFATPGTNTLVNCTGILDFTFGTLAFATTNYTPLSASGTFQYMGYVAGDFNLSAQAQSGLAKGGNWLIQAPIIYGPSNFVAGTGTMSVDKGDFFKATLTQNMTVNMTSGGSCYNAPQRKTVIIIQAASGGPYTVTWPHSGSPTTGSPTVNWVGGTPPTMSAGASAMDVYELVTYDGATWVGQAIQNVS